MTPGREDTDAAEMITEDEAVAFARALSKAQGGFEEAELKALLQWVVEIRVSAILVRLVLTGAALVTWDAETEEPLFQASTPEANVTVN